MSSQFDHVVIGGGISGLGAAHFSLRRGLHTLVLEAGDRLGGCINSRRFEDLDGFWIEGGGHTCFNSYGTLLSIMDDLGLTAQATAKGKVSYRLWKEGKRRSVASALHPFEAMISLPRLFTAPKAGRSVADYYGTVLGRRNYDDLLRYAFQAVICQPADDYPAEALFRRKPRRKDMLRAFTFPGGLSAIPDALAAQAGLETRTGQRIESIEPDGDGFRVTVNAEQPIRCSYVTLAVPPDAAASLMPSGFEDAQVAAAAIGMAEIETLVLVFCVADLDLPPLAGLIAVEDTFYSAVSRDFLPDANYRGFAFHFRPGELGDTARVERACTALGTTPDRIAARAQVRNRLPALRTGQESLMQGLDAAIAGSRLGITGNWFFGVSIEDALTRSRSESDRLFGTMQPG